jgi:hypothetical protein
MFPCTGAEQRHLQALTKSGFLTDNMERATEKAKVLEIQQVKVKRGN